MRENVHRIRYDENVGVLTQARGLDAVDDLHEQRHVSIDQVEARFLGLASQARGNDEDITVSRARIIACINLMVASECAAVGEIKRLAFGQVFVGIEYLNFRNQPAALERVSRAGTHSSAAADDSYLHES